jgi:uncharacterized protein (DUF1810 family)
MKKRTKRRNNKRYSRQKSRSRKSKRKMMRGGAQDLLNLYTPSDSSMVPKPAPSPFDFIKEDDCSLDSDCRDPIKKYCVNKRCQAERSGFDFMNQRPAPAQAMVLRTTKAERDEIREKWRSRKCSEPDDCSKRYPYCVNSRCEKKPAPAPAAPAPTPASPPVAALATGATKISRATIDKLNKFKKKYESPTDGYNTAFDEIKKGQKKSCWSWWIWPVSRMNARDKSDKRKEWSLSEEECKYFILEPGLGDKWVEIMEVLLEKLLNGVPLLYLTKNNPIDEDVVKKSCSFFNYCASKLDTEIPIVKRVLDVSTNILEIP